MRVLLIGGIFLSTLITFYSCQNSEQKGERLARTYCASCHLFPEPSLLDKRKWENGVLPQMAFRMGFEDMNISLTIPSEDLTQIFAMRPAQPMVTKEEWELIKGYYLRTAPDSLPATIHRTDSTLNQFEITAIKATSESPMITMIKADSAHDKIWIGTRSSSLIEFNHSLVPMDTFQMSSPVSSLLIGKNNDVTVSALGIMDPNDQQQGSLINITNDGHQTTLVDSLRRPAYVATADFNKDHLDDFLVCEFGNYIGALSIYQNKGDGTYEQRIILKTPGARNAIIRDVNNDGLPDILALMTQGDEQIVLLTNSGDMKFRMTTLLRFPPVYGSSYFEIADFDHNGTFDILYANGDNADFSYSLKPYHGVRIFKNDGKNKFTESWFYPLNGASQAMARDFDNDGDLDIAAISFFPNFKNHPEEGFVYLENVDGSFNPHTSIKTAVGRWLVMEPTDLDRDGDLDILLGSLNFADRVPPGLFQKWEASKTYLLYLKNTSKTKK